MKQQLNDYLSEKLCLSEVVVPCTECPFDLGWIRHCWREGCLLSPGHEWEPQPEVNCDCGVWRPVDKCHVSARPPEGRTPLAIDGSRWQQRTKTQEQKNIEEKRRQMATKLKKEQLGKAITRIRMKLLYECCMKRKSVFTIYLHPLYTVSSNKHVPKSLL